MSSLNTTKIILFFFLLPMIAPVLYPPRTIMAGYLAILFAMALFAALGFLLLRGSSQALTLMIFLQGLNAIIRIMMFFPNATFSDGSLNPAYVITSVLSIGLSIFLLLRLDQVDVRTRMVS